MRSLRTCVLGILLSVGTAVAANAQPQGFSLYANAFLDSTRHAATRVTAEIPLRQLVFLKKQGLFDARYEVYLSIKRKGDGHSDTHVMRGSATVPTYEETRKRGARSRTYQTYPLAPGDYRIDATLRVKNTRLAYQQSVSVTVPDFLESGVGFGTPVVLHVPSEDVQPFMRWSDFRTRETDVAPELAMFERQPAVRFKLFLEDDPSEPVAGDLFYEVVNPTGKQVLYGKRGIRMTSASEEYVIGFRVDDWDPGMYKVNLRVTTEPPRRDATASVDLRVDVTRSMLTRNFGQTIAILSLIATDEELRALKSAPPSRRAAEWVKFWKARDPDPSTKENEALDEHLARLNYVEANFSKLGPGWRSDRGQVFIRHGAPDQIERTPDRSNRGEYIIWRYYSINRTYIFYDPFGVGDFRLVQGDPF